MDRCVTLSDGRTVGFADFGTEGDTAVVWCHGGPGSRRGPGRLTADARAMGLRLIGIDRPGYGLSSPSPGHTIGSWVPDALAVLDELGIDRFVAAGSSTGGAYALALASLAPERAIGAVTCCALSDTRWAEGKAMMTANRMQDVWDAPTREVALAICAETLGEDGHKMFAAVDNVGLTAADSDLMSDPQVQAAWMAEIPEMFAQGVVGYADDRLADGRGWGSFDVSRIRCPVIVLHGEGDTGVPVAHAHHIAALIPEADLRIFEQHGHFSISTEVLPAIRALLHG